MKTKAKSKPAPQDALDLAVASAIATVTADVAAKAEKAPSDAYAEANPHGEALQPGNPKKRATKALKEAKAAAAPAPAPDAPPALETVSTPTTPGINEAQLEKVSTAFLKTKGTDPPPHLDPESGLWIPKNPNAGQSKPPKAAKEPKPKKAPKPLKQVTGQPSRGPNSTTAVVSMKVPLKTALALAAGNNLRSLSGQAALYILEGLKRDGLINDHPPMTEAKAAE